MKWNNIKPQVDEIDLNIDRILTEFLRTVNVQPKDVGVMKVEI